MTRFTPRVIMNLSALRQDGLFPKSDAPATVLIAEGCHTEMNDCFYFIAVTIYTRRNLRVYIDNDFYLVKSLQRRYWTRSAALNDADLIIAEQMRGNYAAVR